jgi:hypothetical protein
VPLESVKGATTYLSLCVILLNTMYYVIEMYKISYKHTSEFPLFCTFLHV